MPIFIQTPLLAMSMQYPASAYLLFTLFIIAMLGIDLFWHQHAHKMSLKIALAWSGLWICLALAFNIYLYYSHGVEDALSFLTGYLIEKSLSIDNIFVFLMIFRYFHTPVSCMHKVLFWGVFGAILLRCLFIFAGIALLAFFHWVIYVFGAFLIYTGITLALEKDKEIHPENNPLLVGFRSLFPSISTYEGDRFFVVKNSKWLATPLFVVLLSIETSDLIFAVDSIPAILAITQDPFIVFTSNIFAILGLRALFFVIRPMIDLFHLLHYALAAIMIFIGLKMIFSEWIEIPTLWALGFVFVSLSLSVFLSWYFPSKK